MVTLCLAVHGCDEAGGGAVELSWKLRPRSSSSDDKFVDCERASTATSGPVTRIRLNWVVRDDSGNAISSTPDHHDWPCSDNHGVTRFELPEGVAELTVVPMCGPLGSVVAARPEEYIAPAKIQRRVTTGDTVSLGAVELIVEVADCDAQPCICAP